MTTYYYKKRRTNTIYLEDYNLSLYILRNWAFSHERCMNSISWTEVRARFFYKLHTPVAFCPNSDMQDTSQSFKSIIHIPMYVMQLHIFLNYIYIKNHFSYLDKKNHEYLYYIIICRKKWLIHWERYINSTYLMCAYTTCGIYMQ